MLDIWILNVYNNEETTNIKTLWVVWISFELQNFFSLKLVFCAFFNLSNIDMKKIITNAAAQWLDFGLCFFVKLLFAKNLCNYNPYTAFTWSNYMSFALSFISQPTATNWMNINMFRHFSWEPHKLYGIQFE